MYGRDFKGYLSDRASEDPPRGNLTKRELEIAQYLADGLTSKKIAKKLYISESTVNNHIMKARARVGAKTRTHLVAILIRQNKL